MLWDHHRPTSLCQDGVNVKGHIGCCVPDPGFLPPLTATPLQLLCLLGSVRTPQVTALVIAKWPSLCKYNVLVFLHVLLWTYCLQTSFCNQEENSQSIFDKKLCTRKNKLKYKFGYPSSQSEDLKPSCLLPFPSSIFYFGPNLDSKKLTYITLLSYFPKSPHTYALHI